MREQRSVRLAVLAIEVFALVRGGRTSYASGPGLRSHNIQLATEHYSPGEHTSPSPIRTARTARRSTPSGTGLPSGPPPELDVQGRYLFTEQHAVVIQAPRTPGNGHASRPRPAV